jgi:hypothetical protein
MNVTGGMLRATISSIAFFCSNTGKKLPHSRNMKEWTHISQGSKKNFFFLKNQIDILKDLKIK